MSFEGMEYLKVSLPFLGMILCLLVLAFIIEKSTTKDK